jgi:hypothetical protein
MSKKSISEPAQAGDLPAFTGAPVQAPGNIANRDPEFVRVPQLQALAGIKRGLAYRKIADGTFKSVLMREPGNKAGIRLVYWPSVKGYLHDLMRCQSGRQMSEAADRKGAKEA